MNINFKGKCHIEKNHTSVTLCGWWTGWANGIGMKSDLITEKEIKYLLKYNLICKNCVRILRKRREK